jgi:alkanesulfonate monooxygenase SsuD/methylene tetrahydromethanopterin reductase-like flavin-dependent oxidoreductase (luciferase family)
MMPKPLQPGGVPIWVSGGVNPRVVRRLARFGSGWIPWGEAAADVRSEIEQMKQALERIGGNPTSLLVVGLLPAVPGPDGHMDIERTMAAVPSLVSAGVTDVRLHLRPLDDPDENAAHVSAVVAAFRAAAG